MGADKRENHNGHFQLYYSTTPASYTSPIIHAQLFKLLTSALVRSLRVERRRVVRAVKELDELAVADRALLVLELHSLGVVRRAGADLAIGCETSVSKLMRSSQTPLQLTRVSDVGLATRVPDGRLELWQVRVVL